MEMDWQQKFAAIMALSPGANIQMRGIGDWYVSCGIHIKQGGMLCGVTVTGRTTPEEAVNHHWHRITELLKADEYLVLLSPSHTAVRWNGFMWKAVNESK